MILNLFILGPTFITNSILIEQRTSMIIVKATYVTMKVAGPLIVTNNVAPYIIYCDYCNILFTKEINFSSKKFMIVLIHVVSKIHYIEVMEYTNTLFANNIYLDTLIALIPNHRSNLYMFCGFEYVSLRKTSTDLITHYNINFHTINL